MDNPFKQFTINQNIPNAPENTNGRDFVSSPNVLQTAKSIIVGGSISRTSIDPNKGIGTGLPISLGMDVITYASTITLDVTKQAFHFITTTSLGNATINASSPGIEGQIIYLQIANDSGGARTITFGTNFKPSATIVGTASKSATIAFISNGVNWWELSRTLVL